MYALEGEEVLWGRLIWPIVSVVAKNWRLYDATLRHSATDFVALRHHDWSGQLLLEVCRLVILKSHNIRVIALFIGWSSEEALIGNR